MKEKTIKELAVELTVDLTELCDSIKAKSIYTNQLLRSCSPIGANAHEANYASSKADFINKFQIALKECYETDYWLDIFHDAGIITDEEYTDMYGKCSKIRKLLVASITTAKKNSGTN